MKIKKLIKILECIEGDYEGNLPSDMYELGTYRGSKGQISIDDMDFVHVMRAFIKSISYDEGLQHSVSQTNQIMKLEQKVSQLLSREKYLKERVEELTPKKATSVRS